MRLDGNWLKQYSQYCDGAGQICEGLPNVPEEVKRNPTRENTRGHFLGKHNEISYLSKNYSHMCIPYSVGEKEGNKILRVTEEFLDQYPKFPENLRERNLSSVDVFLLQLSKILNFNGRINLRDTIYWHVLPVDVERKEK